jgi:GAF domain-containing protein
VWPSAPSTTKWSSPSGGRLDPFRAPDVRAILETDVDRGHHSVVAGEMTTGDEVVDGALRLAIALAAATVAGADGVSVSLQRYGRLVTVAAGDPAITDMDAEQYANGEGPCVDASLEGRWAHLQSVDERHRWPALVRKARARGINAILCSPLFASGRPIEALNVYSRTAGAFGAEEQELASQVADKAAALSRDELLTMREPPWVVRK